MQRVKTIMEDQYTLRFFVKPVNEYPPIAVRNDTIRIQEGEGPTPIYIARMFDFFQDRDCPRDRPIFIISKTTEKADASEYFTVNTTSGFLYQIKNFDYEDTGIQCGLGKTGGILNVTAKYGSYTMSTILNVNFTDVDDTPPVFVRDDCSTTCYSCPVPAIFVTIDYFDQGIIKTEPSHLKAIDTDSPRSKITYNLTGILSAYL
ncbi:uncharacterized protein LOC134270186 [Saccostrea cucullata]|uniref:uncharacterized protein LOC134270186 n=1 Tax=Saccostrea cuccullata TaxID=36930 RepID=UPI002ED32857